MAYTLWFFEGKLNLTANFVAKMVFTWQIASIIAPINMMFIFMGFNDKSYLVSISFII